MNDKLTVDEINALLQEAADKDMEDVYEDPMPMEFTGDEDEEGWDAFIEYVLANGLPEGLSEEEV